MKINSSAPNLIVICINEHLEGDCSGYFYNYFKKEPVPFSMMNELVLQMEQFFDRINFPQASYLNRVFVKNIKPEQKREMDKVQKPEELLNHSGDFATFVVHVQFRQNATWQGKIVWAEKKEERAFRSALEMIKLMDNAMENSSFSDKKAERFEKAPKRRKIELENIEKE